VAEPIHSYGTLKAELTKRIEMLFGSRGNITAQLYAAFPPWSWFRAATQRVASHAPCPEHLS